MADKKMEAIKRGFAGILGCQVVEGREQQGHQSQGQGKGDQGVEHRLAQELAEDVRAAGAGDLAHPYLAGAVAGAKLGPAVLHSTLGRHAARAIRAAMIAELALGHWEKLVGNIGSGDTEILLPNQPNMVLELESEGGDIQLDIDAPDEIVERNETRIRLKVGAGGPEFKVWAKDGDITVSTVKERFWLPAQPAE